MVRHIERPPTLPAAAADSIRDSIFHGELRPGERLREVELCKSLDVSRSTIREALRKLQEESLVEVLPHRGAFVTKLSPRTARELYTFRAIVEPYALRLAVEANAYSAQDLARLGALALQLGELEASRADIYRTVKTDVEFHYLICSRSDHRLLLETLKSLQSLTWLFVFHVQLYHADVYSDEPSHHDIFQAIQSADPAAAEETLRNHINSAGKALLICMEQMDWQSLNLGEA